MKSIINDVYYITLEKLGNDLQNKLKPSKAFPLYEKLCDKLDKENLEIFTQFVDDFMEENAEKSEEIYRLGFQTGGKIVLEILQNQI